MRNVLLPIFKKNSPPQKWRPLCIFEFLPKMAKHKFPSISLTVRDRAISSKFSTHRVCEKCTLANFQKNFPSPKMAASLYFRILPKMAKRKFPSISLTVRDRAISSKFSTHRVSEKCTLGNFQNIFPSPKIAAILNFQILAKNGKTQFYCATIAYHVGLNALLVAARHHNQRLRKNTFILGRSLRLSSRDLPLMLQLFSLVAAILQSLEVFTAFFFLYLSAVLLLNIPINVVHLLLYKAHSGQFSALPLCKLSLF